MMVPGKTGKILVVQTKPFFSRAPRLWTTVAVLLGSVEIWALARAILSAEFMPEFISTAAPILAVGVALPFIAAFGYIVWCELRSSGSGGGTKSISKDPWLVRSWQAMAAFFALALGWAATFFAFGSRGPFSSFMNGVSGPELPVDEKYWPLVFAAGVALGLFIAKSFAALLKTTPEE